MSLKNLPPAATGLVRIEIPPIAVPETTPAPAAVLKTYRPAAVTFKGAFRPRVAHSSMRVLGLTAWPNVMRRLMEEVGGLDQDKTRGAIKRFYIYTLLKGLNAIVAESGTTVNLANPKAWYGVELAPELAAIVARLEEEETPE